jgi:hypothetical protein
MSNTSDKREKIEALKLARDCYPMRLDLLTNSSVINDSMRFIEKSKQNLSNKKELIDSSDLQGSTEDSISEQYNNVF